jgi:hypothetical protein
MKKESRFKIGDSVVVRKGITDPDMGGDISGRQGRINNIEHNEPETDLVEVEWDSVTLKQIPSSVIEHCEEEEFEWDRMNLLDTDLDPAQPRDTEDDVWNARDELTYLHTWDGMGEEGKRIREIVAGIGPDEEIQALKAWHQKMKKDMTFPFQAEVAEAMEEEDEDFLKLGDLVTVTRIADLDDVLGILVEVAFQNEKYINSLSDLKATDKNSPNYQLLRDYQIWFANK